MVTKNPDDFYVIYSEFPTHPGVILIYQDNDITRDMSEAEIAAAIGFLEQAWSTCGGVANGIHRLNDWRVPPAPEVAGAEEGPSRPRRGRRKK